MIDTEYLTHYGISGQKWGVRRFQNDDGTLTPEGKKKYLNSDGSKKTDDRGYIKSRKTLYLDKKKEELKEAKKTGNKARQLEAKIDYKFAKDIQKKGGLSNYVPSAVKEVMGNMSKDEKILFDNRETKDYVNKQRTNKILRTVGPIAIGLLGATIIAQGKSIMETGKFGKMSIKMVNGVPTIVSTVKIT